MIFTQPKLLQFPEYTIFMAPFLLICLPPLFGTSTLFSSALNSARLLMLHFLLPVLPHHLCRWWAKPRLHMCLLWFLSKCTVTFSFLVCLPAPDQEVLSANTYLANCGVFSTWHMAGSEYNLDEWKNEQMHEVFSLFSYSIKEQNSFGWWFHRYWGLFPSYWRLVVTLC